MSSTPNSPASEEFGSFHTGVCVPEDFAAAPIREAVARVGDSLVFWDGDRRTAIVAARERQPDLVLFGANRADPASLEWVRALHEGCPETRVILICKRTGDGEVRRVLDAGARALVALSDIDGAMRPVMEAVRAGQVTVPRDRRGELRKQALTKREKQILGLVVMGLTNAEIATKLFLAESTVKSHLSSAFTKLGVSSRSEAASVILDPRSSAGLGILTIPTG